MLATPSQFQECLKEKIIEGTKIRGSLKFKRRRTYIYWGK
jgi:hypothetical protein